MLPVDDAPAVASAELPWAVPPSWDADGMPAHERGPTPMELVPGQQHPPLATMQLLVPKQRQELPSVGAWDRTLVAWRRLVP